MTTLKDVAEAAKVSPTTVSRIINGDSSLKVSDGTRETVQQKIEELGYRVKTKRSIAGNKVALITALSEERSVNDSYWQSICLSIERHAKDIEITNLIRLSDDFQKHQLEMYDAVILVGDLSEQSINQLASINPNLVAVDSKAEHIHVTNIAPDFEIVMKEILESLQANQYQAVAYIGGMNRLQDVQTGQAVEALDDRYYMYQSWIKNHGRTDYSYIGEWDAQTGYEGVEKLLAQSPTLNAIIVGSDLVAMGAMNKLKELELVPGKDIQVISFDNLDFSQYLNPSLTSVDLNIDALAQMAINQAVSLAQAPRDWMANIKIPGKILYRDTYQG